MKKKLKLSIFELIAYSVLLLVGLWGLVYICLGVCCEFINYKSAVAKADVSLKETFGGLGFLWSGLIIIGSAALLAVIILLIYAKQSDRDFEKAQRRAARLLKKGNDTVDAVVEPAEKK